MASAELYRKYAADCVRVAQQVRDPVDKATLLQMAEIWFGMAMKAENASSRERAPVADGDEGSKPRSK